MLDTINSLLLKIADPALGWLLSLPHYLILLILALATALILTLVRLFTTNQEYLGRCKRDKSRLKELLREAKSRGEKDDVMRIRTTMGQIGMKQMAAEGKPLLVSLVPIAILAVWAFSRIAYQPVPVDQPVVVKAYFPKNKIGKPVHIVPQEGLRAVGGWIKLVGEDAVVTKDEQGNDKREVTNGLAEWHLECTERDEPYVLPVRFMGETFNKELIVDGVHYAPPMEVYDPETVHMVEIKMDEYNPFGFVPGWSFFQPWIVGYLIFVLPLSFILKPVLRIH